MKKYYESSLTWKNKILRMKSVIKQKYNNDDDEFLVCLWKRIS